MLTQPSQLEQDARSTRRRYGAALLGVVVLAAAFRFGGVTRVGVRWEDEAWYASDARLWHRCLLVLTDGDAISAALHRDKPAFQARMDAVGVDLTGRYRKPSQGYTFLGSLMMFVVGDRPAALLVTNALCGTLAVVVLYGIGLTLFDRRVGLCAALLLAVSPYHIVYCRSLLPDTSSGLLVLVGVLAWALGRTGRWPWRRAYVLAGIAFGYGSTCHYRTLIIAAIPALVEGWSWLACRWAREPERLAPNPGFVRRWAWGALGFAIPLLAIESTFQGARLAATVSDSHLPLATFFEEGLRWFTKINGRSRATAFCDPEVLAAYGQYVVHWHGWAAAALMGLGLPLVLKAKDAARLPGIFVLITLCGLAISPFRVARGISPLVPFLCLSLAVAVLWLSSRARLGAAIRPVLATVLIVAAVGPATGRAWRLLGNRSQLEEACAFVAQDGGGTLAVANPCGFRLYLERSDVFVDYGHKYWGSDGLDTVVNRLRAGGVRWVITEPVYWAYWPSSNLFKLYHGLEEQLAQDAVRVAEFPHVSDHRWQFLSEGTWAGLRNLPEMARHRGGVLRVYDLRALPSAPSAAVQAVDGADRTHGEQG